MNLDLDLFLGCVAMLEPEATLVAVWHKLGGTMVYVTEIVDAASRACYVEVYEKTGLRVRLTNQGRERVLEEHAAA